MRKFVYSALALSAAVSPALATEDDWLTLDQELEALPTLLEHHEGGPNIGGFIVSTYRYTQDAGGVADAETSDFAVERARLDITGDLGDTGYSYRLQGEFTNDVTLEGAWIQAPITDGIHVRMGRQRINFVRSGMVMDNHLFFLDRTFNGTGWRERSEGAQLFGTMDALRWYLGAFDGKDGAGTDHLFNARVEYDVMGSGLTAHEGAGGGDDPALMVAASFSTDGGAATVDGNAVVGGTAFALEANMQNSIYSFGAEIVNYSDNDNGTAFINGVANGSGDAATTYAVFGTFMLAQNGDNGAGGWEAGLRYEDFEDLSGDTRITVGVNNYLLPEHQLKWQLQYRQTMNDAAEDESQFGVGLVASF